MVRYVAIAGKLQKLPIRIGLLVESRRISRRNDLINQCGFADRLCLESGDVFDGVGQLGDRLDVVFAHVPDAERLFAEL
jgi:hypothetical protein